MAGFAWLPGTLPQTGGRVTTWPLPGAAELASTGAGASLDLTGPVQAVVLDDDEESAVLTGTWGLPADGALGIALRVPPGGAALDPFEILLARSNWSTALQLLLMSSGDVLASVDGQVAFYALPGPVDDDVWRVLVVSWTADGSTLAVRLHVDGEQAAATSGTWYPPVEIAEGYLRTGLRNTQVALVEVRDGVTDPYAFTQDIYAATGIEAPTHEGAAGSWTITGTATVMVGDPPIPELPAGTPGGAVTPPPLPEPQAPPPGVPDPVLWRVSEVMPSPDLDGRGNPVAWTPSQVIREQVGRIQVVVEGVDITYLDGAPLPVPSWTRTEPFGSAAATIQVPQITPFHRLPDWCVPGASVDIRIARTGGGVGDLFAGVIGTFGHRADTGLFTIECVGALYTTDLQLRQPAFLTQPRDIGDVVAEVLNSAVSRRHDALAPVVTGCLTSVLGGWEPRVTGYLQQILATAVTGGRQWTVACDVRSPVLRLKDTDTVSWTIHNGQRGVQIDLTQDWTKAPNVIYGEGIGNDGGRWRNAMYPNWRPDTTPLFPMAPSRFFRVGTTDAQTTTGRGVSDWQARVGQPVTGRFSQSDRQRTLAVQAAAGIQRDGTVGPQTWAATFGTGSNTGTLECFYLPIAFAPNVMPRLYGPDGADLGPNPEYDPAVLRVEEKLDYGQGVDKAEGVRAAGEYLARAINPGWVGRVVFEADPQETSRYLIREGSNGIIRGFRGEDLKVHVAQVDYAEDSVGLTVDTNARDFPMLDAIRERERNATDPAKAYQKRPNKGSLTEARATFDAESPAGHVPRFALFSNLWSVIRVPFGAYGSIVRTELTTSGPARPFSVAVFDRPITAARLLTLAGNPLSADENPWSEKADDLDAAGLLMSWGWENQPAGYYPGEYTDPDGETDAPVTGRLLDDASWDYVSTQAPWLWVAIIASGSCFVQGRFWPGVD
ncbi:hypothetical protein [Cellulomonas sp.]|uniref:peptidoglycan-binding domain-containing protein n=1 Tax=Cellulomonas sp. TaxID=40001 RepID=UPI001B09A485|nr:hypothetical protein [Cellulomonas sp.]MBO9555616.1 hypothetical protein [Cellulomonas sp.]